MDVASLEDLIRLWLHEVCRRSLDRHMFNNDSFTSPLSHTRTLALFIFRTRSGMYFHKYLPLCPSLAVMLSLAGSAFVL